MPDPFESELEALVAKYAREMTREITAILLRRLGIAGALPAARRAASGPKPSPRGARAVSPPRAKSVQAPKPRKRSSAQERLAAVEKVARVVEASDGLSLGEVERAAGLPRGVVSNALQALKNEGRIYMGGTRRLAKYAATQDIADKASAEATRR